MKVIFGGAFNPVTNAHIEVYHYVNGLMDIDEFIYLPVSSAYTKSELASNFHRKNMLEIATKNLEGVSVSEMEMNDSDFLGTYQSLIRFSDSQQDEIGFIVGADNLIGMEHWINIEGILSEFKIIVLARNNLNIHELIDMNPILKKHKSNFIICDDFQINISSTHFRESMDKSYVPEDVYDYIMENQLYVEEEHEEL